jgi:M6 family metalloprotease-like protein
LFSEGVSRDWGPTGQQVFGSLNDYYLEQSCGKFRVRGRVFDCVKVRRGRAAYADDADRDALLREALDRLLARDGLDTLKGYDGLCFLYAGEQTGSGPGGLYWPHQGVLSHGDRRWCYFLCPEGGERMTPIGVIAHEFGHLIGLPDLYAKPEAPGASTAGVWCTMANGHGREGKPVHLSAWCKEQLGWLKPAVLDTRVPQKLLLRPVEGSPRECFKVWVKPDAGEYLLLENRVVRGFDRDLPGEALLVWHVAGGRPRLVKAPAETGPLSVTDVRRRPGGDVTFRIGPVNAK